MGGNLTVYVAGTDRRVKAAAPSVGGSGFRYEPWPLLPQEKKLPNTGLSCEVRCYCPVKGTGRDESCHAGRQRHGIPVEQRAERFIREAKACVKLMHPNICQVYDAGTINRQPFLSMAYIEGESLESRIDPDLPMSQRDAAQ